MAIIIRTITGTVRHQNGEPWPEARIKLELVSSIVAGAVEESVYVRSRQVCHCNANGVIPTGASAPKVLAGYTYKLSLPDGASGNFVAPTTSSDPLSIDEVIGLIAGGTAEDTEGYTAVPEAAADWLADLPAVNGYLMQRHTVEAGETVTIPAGHTMLVAPGFTNDGRIEVNGRLTVLGTAAEASKEEFGVAAATAVASHNAARDDVHGIADTRLLETQSGAQAKATAAAAAAQTFAIQRSNHTGTQLLSTISNAGTMAAQAATNYHATSVFSANPTTDQPLKADGLGGLRLTRLGVNTAATAQLHVTASAAATIGAVVRVAASATANAQQWQNSSAAVMAAVTATGNLELGQQATSSHEISGKLRSSTTSNTQAARIKWSWTVSTHATRQAALRLYASDYGGERTGMIIGANGTQPIIGFYGVTAVARQLLATGAGATVDQVITALQNLGLLRQS